MAIDIGNLIRGNRRVGFVVALGLSVTLGGCLVRGRAGFGATVSPGVVVYQDPPPPRMVVQPAAPYGGAVWVEGNWQWNGAQWVWADGYWQQPRVGYVYVQPRWERRGNGWVHVEGRWNQHRPGHNRPNQVQVQPAPVQVRPGHQQPVQVRPAQQPVQVR